MKVWLVKIGEGARGGRPFRIDMMAQGLLERGHRVRLYTSTFCHNEKTHLYPATTERALSDSFSAVYLHSPGYRNNVSLGRLWDHRQIGRIFAAHARVAEQRPDLILCCLPTLELAAESIRLGELWRIPVVIDIRDPWPDVYFRVFPHWAQSAARQVLSPMIRRAQATLARAGALTAVSQQYLDWGLRGAGRGPSQYDAVFGLSYTPAEFDASALEQARQKLEARGVDFSRRLCVFSGTLGSSYDIEGLLGCAARLAAEPRFADVSVVVLGDGDKRALLTAPDLAKNVVYTGWVGQAELQCVMQRATLGFMPYTNRALQSLPNKVYEYMAYGIPIVSSLQGEAEQLLDSGGCGISYPPEDVRAMTAAVMQLLDDPARLRAAAQAGRSIYQANYRPEQVYARMAAHLEKVAAGLGPVLQER